MTGRGGIYEGPYGDKLYGDGKEVESFTRFEGNRTKTEFQSTGVHGDNSEQFVEFEKREFMDFGEAIRAMKAGEKVSRSGWNGKDMWVALSPGQVTKSEQIWSHHVREFAMSNGGQVKVLPSIVMKTVQGDILIGWLASQTDMVAEDWFVVK